MGKTSYLLGIIVTILIGTYIHIICCSSCGTAVAAEDSINERGVVAPTASKATAYPFTFSYGVYTYNTSENFNFNMSSLEYIEPLFQNVLSGGTIPGPKNHRTEDENKIINSTGYCKDDETNSSTFPNLGLARADSVKNFFVSQEIPSSRIKTMGQLKSDMVADGNTRHNVTLVIVEDFRPRKFRSC